MAENKYKTKIEEKIYEMLARKESIPLEYIAVLDDIKKWRDIVKNNLLYYDYNNTKYFGTKESIITAYGPNTAKPDIAFLDINLDQFNDTNKEGFEICRFFKNTSRKTTVVVMSSLEGITEEAIKNGAEFIIQKKNFVQDFDKFIQQYKKGK